LKVEDGQGTITAMKINPKIPAENVRFLLVMKIFFACVFLWLATSTHAATNAVAASSNLATTNTTKRYVVMLKRDADQDRCVNEHAINRGRTFRHAINGFVADLKSNAVERLRKDSRVVIVAEDRIAAHHTGQLLSPGLLRLGINNFPPVKIDGTDKRVNVDVAVIDSGIQPDHPDLNVVQAVSVAGNGLVGISHGTSCAGIIGALDNDFGVVGVAPGVRLWSVRADQDGDVGFYTSDIIAAFNYVAQHADQISVVNCSFATFYGFAAQGSLLYQSAIQALINQGVVVPRKLRVNA
jgi:subtilisin